MKKLLQKIKKFLFGELYVVTYFNSKDFIVRHMFIRAKNEDEAIRKGLNYLKTIPFAITFMIEKIDDEEI